MKTSYFYNLVILLSLFSAHSYGQKGNYNPSEINPEKIAYVAQNKTDALDKIVHLDERKQKKLIYQIYESYELKEQKRRRVKNSRVIPSSSRGKSAEDKSDKRDHSEKEIKTKKYENQLQDTKEVDEKIKKLLNKNQQQLLLKHQEEEKELMAQ